MNNFVKTYAPVLLLFFICLLFFAPYLTFQSFPYAGDFTGSDLTELNVPLRYLAAQSWAHGQVPLWTDALSNGFPLLAEGQAGVFYPLNLLVYGMFPFSQAITISLLIHFFLAAWFTYLLGRQLGLSRWGAMLAGISFAFGGSLVFRIKHVNLLNAAVWLPLLFLMLERLHVSRFRWRWIAGMAAIFAIQFFAGHPQISYISALSCGVYSFIRFFQTPRPERRLRRFAGAWVLISLLSLGLAAVQLLPTAELALNSARSVQPSYAFATQFSLPPEHLLTLFSPYAYGNPATASYRGHERLASIFWEDTAYLGILPLILVGLSLLFWRKDWRVRGLGGLCLVVGLFVFGRFNPIYPWLWQIVPGLKIFRFPQRFSLVAALALAVLTGIGFDRLMEWWRRHYGTHFNRPPSAFLRTSLSFLLLVVVVVDLFLIASAYWGVMPASYLDPPRSARVLAQDPERFRIVSLDWGASWNSLYRISEGWLSSNALLATYPELLPPNLNALWGLESAQDRGWAEGGQESARLTELWQRFAGFERVGTSTPKISERALRVWGLQNVKYFLALSDVAGPDLKLKDSIAVPLIGAVRLYQNPFVLPRAFPVFDVEVASTTDQVLERLADPAFDPRSRVIVETPLPELGTSTPSGTVEILRWDNGQVEAEADLSAAGLVVFSQAWYPGWQARVDGQPAQLIRADLAFQAVPVPSGRHRISLRFVSPVFQRGAAMSGLTASLMLVGWMVMGWRRRVKNNNNITK